MKNELSICKQIFKRDPELQDNAFIIQRLHQTRDFLTKTLKGLPKDETTEKCFNAMLELLNAEMHEHIHTIGHYVLKMMVEDLDHKDFDKNADTVCTNNDPNEKQKEKEDE